MPSISKLASAFEIPYIYLNSTADMDAIINMLLGFKGPVICEILTDEDQEVLFKQGYKSNGDGTFSPQNLSEMYPFIRP